jgi:hypothetical protein
LPDSVLVYQMTPVVNGAWGRRAISTYDVDYTLNITDGDLATDAIPNACAQLTGVARDSLSGTTLDALTAAYTDDAGNFNLRSVTGTAKTYSFVWPDSLPPGAIYFSRPGYHGKKLRVPDGVDSLGNRYYKMNVRLSARPSS